MGTLTFDTLAYSTGLQKAGFSREQADAMTRALVNAVNQSHAQDTASTAMRYNPKGHYAGSHNDILFWLVIAYLAQTTLIITAFGVAVAILQR